jgi:hypothetical protein
VTSSEPNKFNYDIIQKFNEKMYQTLLFPSNISGGEMFVKKAKNDTGEDLELNLLRTTPFSCYQAKG